MAQRKSNKNVPEFPVDLPDTAFGGGTVEVVTENDDTRATLAGKVIKAIEEFTV